MGKSRGNPTILDSQESEEPAKDPTVTRVGFHVRSLQPRLVHPLMVCIPLLLVGALTGCAFEFTPEPIPPAFPAQSNALPVSGYEFEFEPILWNDGKDIQESTNCYAYVLNRRTGFPVGHKLQPGEFSGDPLDSVGEIDASRIIELVRSDAEVEGFFFEESEAQSVCPDGTYKVALVVDPGVDYHWYRQNPDGTWSHKPGHLEVTDVDASGNKVYDPSTADRDYGFPNYSEFGGFFCMGER